jgi:DNA-binding transcriptional ArsR family regulator
MEGPPELGPLTQAIGKCRKGKPPALLCEWSDHLDRPGEYVLLWAAAARLESGWQGWYSMDVRTCNEEPSVALPQADGAKVERLLSPLAHQGRIDIMKAMYLRPMTPAELTEATGFQGGGLYHHLKELRYAEYVAQEDGRYRLTPLGRQLLLTVACIASRAIQDRGEGGLAVAADWEKSG